MISRALGHYPHIRFRNGEKMLWNPVLRKSYKMRPEERVRLQIVEYLLHEAGFSRSRISFESPVRLRTDKSQSRTDLICYTEDMQPLLLGECKSADIRLDDKTAFQIGRYNTKVGAPFLLITNGIKDYWFEVSEDQVTKLEEPPEAFAASADLKSDADYWKERGFFDPSESVISKEIILPLLYELFSDRFKPVKYLGFGSMPPELGLEHFYAIRSAGEDQRIALSFSSLPGDSRFNAVLNVQGSNVAYLSASLSRNTIPAVMESASGKQSLELKGDLPGHLRSGIGATSDFILSLLSTL